MKLALDGITVVTVEQAVAAPLATRQLADLGARVIKVERPDGGDFARYYDHAVSGQSSNFVWLNRGKESIQLDLKAQAGVDALHGLLARADVVVCNLAPSARERLGLTVSELAGRYPALIACFISGYRPDGPNRTKKAYDALIQAEAGLMSITGGPGAPAKSGVSAADIAAGTQALTGVLAAIRHRDIHGEALPVEVSLFDALTEWMSYPLYYTQYGGEMPEPMGTAHPTIAPYGAFAAADGQSVLIAVQNEREWVRLCAEVLDDSDMARDTRFKSNSDRVANRDELEAVLRAGFARYPADEVVHRLEAAGIAWGRLTEIADLAGHPELAAEQRWIDTVTPTGTVRTLRPVGTPGGRSAAGNDVPRLGAHTTAVLTEFGLADVAETEGDR